MIWCIHHTDLDGLSAASHVVRAQKDVRCIPFNYEGDLPFDKVQVGDTLYLVDISIGEKDVETFKSLCKRAEVIWCDHHATSLETLENHPELYSKFRGLVDKEFCGSMLTYMFLNNCSSEDVPYWVFLVDDFDCWKMEDPLSMAFMYATQVEDMSPGSKLWDDVDSPSFMEDLLILGEKIEKFMNGKYEAEQRHVREATLSDFPRRTFAVLNTSYFGSQVFGDLLDRYDACVVYRETAEGYKYSIYSPEDGMDVSEVAKSFGGGGHIHAAGFITKTQVFKIKG